MLTTWDVEADMRDWWADALCNDGTGTLAELFFSEQLDDIARAKAICATCPVIKECREQSLAVREPYGVWGGLSEDERTAILAARVRHRRAV